MPRRQNDEGKSKAVIPVAPAQANTDRAPDPFIERIGNGYAERTLREQWTELEARIQGDITRAHSFRGLGIEGHEKSVCAEKHLHNTAALMAFVFDRLNTVDFMFRDVAAEIVAGDGTEECEGSVDYGERTLRDHWAQLRGRLRADIEHIRGSCIYGRMGSLPGGFRKRQGTVADDIEEYIRQIEVLMEDFVWFEIATVDEYLGHVADILEARSHLSAERDQKEGQEPAAH